MSTLSRLIDKPVCNNKKKQYIWSTITENEKVLLLTMSAES